MDTLNPVTGHLYAGKFDLQYSLEESSPHTTKETSSRGRLGGPTRLLGPPRRSPWSPGSTEPTKRREIHSATLSRKLFRDR